MSNSDKLKNIRKAIDDTFGKGSVFLLNDEEHANVDVIPTGIMSLDHALGCGGVARGRIVELVGEEAAGKCLVKETYINTKEGLMTIEEIFNSQEILPSCTNGEIEKKFPLINETGDVEYTTHFTKNGRRKVYKITTQSGSESICTSNHPWKVIGKSGFLEWKKTEDLTTNDFLSLSRSISDKQPVNDEQLDLAYSLGLLIADAHLGENSIRICNNDPYIQNFIKTKLPSILNTSYKEYDRFEKNTVSYQFNSKEAVNKFYLDTGLTSVLSKDKSVPLIIRKNKNLWISFLKGYVDCEGSIDNTLEISSASKKLLFEVKLMLQSYGIFSSLNKKTVKSYPENEYFRLSLSGENVKIYLETVGTNRKDWSNINFERLLNHNQDNIPNQKMLIDSLFSLVETTRETYVYFGDYINNKVELTYNRLKKIVDFSEKTLKNNILLKHFQEILSLNYYYDKIVSIEYVGEEPTFDFAMSETHSFIANGAVSHNTSLALKMVAEFQKQGLIAAYIDVEHALDLSLATILGVDIDSMLVIQPDSAEDALEQIEALARTGDVGIVVLDSVAALSPRAELDGTMSDSQMGLLARLMGKNIRKITGVLSKTNTTLVCLNQFRQKIGVFFGDPRTTPGGNALKYAASLRMEISKNSQIKDGDTPIGHTMGIKILKNKLAVPFKKVAIPVIYGVGFDILADVVNFAVETKVIEVSGTTYSFQGEKIAVGLNRTKKNLAEDSKLYGKILKELEALKKVK